LYRFENKLFKSSDDSIHKFSGLIENKQKVLSRERWAFISSVFCLNLLRIKLVNTFFKSKVGLLDKLIKPKKAVKTMLIKLVFTNKKESFLKHLIAKIR